MAETITNDLLKGGRYNVDLDYEKENNYYDMYVVSGRPVESRVFNTLQLKQKIMLMDMAKYLGIKEGDRMVGRPTIDGTTVKIHPGTVFFVRGWFVEVTSTIEVTITGTGQETIGLVVQENAINCVDDPNLKIKAFAYVDENGITREAASGKGFPGADRQQILISFATSGYEFPVFRFNNGAWIDAKQQSTSLLTYDAFAAIERWRSGAYTRHPTDTYIKTIVDGGGGIDHDKVRVFIAPNEYTVNGYRESRIQESAVTANLAKEKITSGDNSFAYNPSIDYYAVPQAPIATTDDIHFQQTGYVQMTRGSGDTDQIVTGDTSGNPLASYKQMARGNLPSGTGIISAYENGDSDPETAATTTYTAGVDYEQSGNSILWLTANRPAGTYWVNVRVNTTAIKAIRTVNKVTGATFNVGGSARKDLPHNDIYDLEIVGYVRGTDYQVINHNESYVGQGSTPEVIKDPNTEWTTADYAELVWFIAPPAGDVTVSYIWLSHTKEGHIVTRDSFDKPYDSEQVNSEELETFTYDSTDYIAEGGYRKYLWFNTSTTEKPETGASVFYDYEYYLPRKALLFMNYEGNFVMEYGVSSLNPIPPNIPERALPLATYDMPADSLDIDIFNLNHTAFTISDMHNLKKELTELRRITATHDLQADVDGTVVRNDYAHGIFTDNAGDVVPGNRHADYNFSKGGVSWGARQNIFDKYYTVKFASTPVKTTLAKNAGGSSNVEKGFNFYRLSGTASTVSTAPVELKQLLASSSKSANPYGWYTRLPSIIISPDESVLVEETVTIKNPTRDTGMTYRQLEVPSQSLVTNIWNFDSWQRNAVRFEVGAASSGNRQAFNQNFGDVIVDQKTITIDISGEGFKPNEDNIKVYFEGNQVTLSSQSLAGTQSGTVKADANGDWTAQFDTPEGTKVGLKTVKADESTTDRFAVCQFNGRGIEKVEVITDPPLPRPRVSPPIEPVISDVSIATNNPGFYDPIGQTVISLGDYDIVGGVLYAETKASGEDLIVFIRETSDNNEPKSAAIGSKRLAPADVSVSADGTTATTFNFEDVIPFNKGEFYFFGAGSDSTLYKLWAGQLGSKDIVDDSILITNDAYKWGKMAKSPDGTVWMTDPEYILKFALLPMVYETSGTLLFDSVSQTATSFILHAKEYIREGTAIKWMYSADGGAYTEFEPNEVVNLSSQASSIQVKAVLSTTNTYISPLIRGNVTLETRINSTSGNYISVDMQLNGTNRFHTVYAGAKIYKPSVASITAYFSYDSGVTWQAIGSPDQTTDLEMGWQSWKWEWSEFLDAPDIDAADATPQTSGGSLADDDYYYQFTATCQGEGISGETEGCTEFMKTVSGGSGSGSIDFDLDGKFPTGATGGKVYRGTTSGSLTLIKIFSTVPTEWTDDGSDPDSDVIPPPSVSTAPDFKTKGQIRFLMETTNNAVIPKVTDIYHYLVR